MYRGSSVTTLILWLIICAYTACSAHRAPHSELLRIFQLPFISLRNSLREHVILPFKDFQRTMSTQFIHKNHVFLRRKILLLGSSITERSFSVELYGWGAQLQNWYR